MPGSEFWLSDAQFLLLLPLRPRGPMSRQSAAPGMAAPANSTSPSASSDATPTGRATRPQWRRANGCRAAWTMVPASAWPTPPMIAIRSVRCSSPKVTCQSYRTTRRSSTTIPFDRPCYKRRPYRALLQPPQGLVPQRHQTRQSLYHFAAAIPIATAVIYWLWVRSLELVSGRLQSPAGRVYSIDQVIIMVTETPVVLIIGEWLWVIFCKSQHEV